MAAGGGRGCEGDKDQNSRHQWKQVGEESSKRGITGEEAATVQGEEGKVVDLGSSLGTEGKDTGKGEGTQGRGEVKGETGEQINKVEIVQQENLLADGGQGKEGRKDEKEEEEDGARRAMAADMEPRKGRQDMQQ
ncbi:hypothetical protein CBR_g9053 [Chara braunii]|uniref:Uncharacterized protein n=1 Tax=Chara braunii TaxID=69332 RepID=A0A388KNM7_CHABU|nr:hypothetical protein CBR_g9053 [Chara braunii]|eukprot:GBG71637.1 hypothetical protein CBR_g9053 [Chara braunii]